MRKVGVDSEKPWQRRSSFFWRCCYDTLIYLGYLRRVMNINLDQLPAVIYACFVLYNYCVLNNEAINQETVKTSIRYDREFQPETVHNHYVTNSNETEGKRIRRMLTNHFDP